MRAFTPPGTKGPVMTPILPALAALLLAALAPPALAAQPVERRAFSVEPQTQKPTQAPPLAAAPAQPQDEVRRSFSYEPVTAAPTYSRVRSSKPHWMMQKSDADKFR